MATKNIDLQRKLQFLEKYILRQHVILRLDVLSRRDHTQTELRALGLPKSSKFMNLLSITKKYSNDNGIKVYSLTEKGKRLNDAVQQLLKETENFLPEGD